MISYQIFYIMGLLIKIENMIQSIFMALIMILFILFVSFLAQLCREDLEEEKIREKKRDFKKISRRLLIAIMALGILNTFLPTEKTMIQMLVAKQLSFENIESGKSTVKEAVDYIFEKLEDVEQVKKED